MVTSLATTPRAHIGEDLKIMMKRLLLAGTAFLGSAASGSVACATPFDFTYTGNEKPTASGTRNLVLSAD